MIEIKNNVSPSEILKQISADDFAIFNSETVKDRTWIVAYDGETAVGYISYTDATVRYPNKIGLKVICVHNDYKNQKIGNLLLKEFMNICNSIGKEIHVGYYEPDGEKFIRPKIEAHNYRVGW